MTPALAALPFNLSRPDILAAARRLSTDQGQRLAAALATRRLGLRMWVATDCDDLIALDTNPRVTRHVIDLSIADRRQATAFMAIANALCKHGHGLGLWRTGARDSDRFLGYFLLAPGPDGRIEIGTRLAPHAWGRGYALEGSRFLCAHAIETLHLPEVWGFCHPDNRAVPVLLRRLHFMPLGATTHLGRDALAFRLDAATWRRHPAPARARAVVARVLQTQERGR